jgi:hypothetical protein
LVQVCGPAFLLVTTLIVLSWFANASRKDIGSIPESVGFGVEVSGFVVEGLGFVVECLEFMFARPGLPTCSAGVISCQFVMRDKDPSSPTTRGPILSPSEVLDPTLPKIYGSGPHGVYDMQQQPSGMDRKYAGRCLIFGWNFRPDVDVVEHVEAVLRSRKESPEAGFNCPSAPSP